MEEDIVYPFVREHVDDGDAMIDRAEVEHAEAKAALRAFEVSDPATAAFKGRLKTLRKLVTAHVKEEEKHVLPKLDEVDVVVLNGLRGELERARPAMSPEPDLPSEATARRTRRSTTRTGASSARRRGPASSKRHVWVQPHHLDDQRWQVRREGATRASRVFDRQADAVEFGRSVARRERVELIVAGRDGSVRKKVSYGNDDPRRPG